MKCFIEDFRELDIDELLAVNGGYGSGSSGGGYKKTSGGGGGGSGSGSYGAVTSNSRNQTSWDVWVANKDGRNSSGEITRPHDPYRDSPRNSGNYKGTSFVPDNNLTEGPVYIKQQEFSNIYGVAFGNTACAATSLLNEISERYLLETGRKMTKEESIDAMKAAVSAGYVGRKNTNSNGDIKFEANVNDWAAAANTMWETTGLNGSFVVNETVNADHVIYALDTKGGPAADHFVNSNGDGTFYDPYYDTTFKVEDYHLQEGRNYRGVDFVK